MKKIKNPEKYIQKLKAEIYRLNIRLEDERHRKRQYAGTCIVNWSSTVETTEDCSGQGLGAFRVGNYVAVIGKVVEVHEDQYGSKIRFNRFQTKKVDAI